MFRLTHRAEQLYGNGHINLKQAASYANTPDKQLFVFHAISTMTQSQDTVGRTTYGLVAPKEVKIEAWKAAKELFPKLNHREQA